jgi:hypothetical protein
MRGKVLFVPVALVAVVALLTSCGGLTNAPSPHTASMGQGVHDGKFAFTVIKVDPATPKIGDQTAQGEFIAVHLNVKNIGNEAQTFFPSNQKLKDNAGKSYSDDLTAEEALSQGNSILDDINPGLSVDRAVVFDVPQGTEPAAIELHDSAFSDGATVKLS